MTEHDHEHDLNQASSASVLHDREHCLMLVDGNPSNPKLKYVAIHAHGDPAFCYSMHISDSYLMIQCHDGSTFMLPIPPKPE